MNDVIHAVIPLKDKGYPVICSISFALFSFNAVLHKKYKQVGKTS